MLLNLLIPEIDAREITFIDKEQHGFAYWDVETKQGRCRFTIRLNSNSVIYLDDVRLLITDLDENRFEIPDYTRLSGRELKKLDLFL